MNNGYSGRDEGGLRRERSGERGSAYVLAIVALLSGLILGLALMRASSAYFQGESTRKGVQESKYIAEAGIEYAAWQITDNHLGIPYTADVNLSTGNFHVTASDDSARDQGAVLLTSTGTAGGCTYTAKRVIQGTISPFDYALCVNGNLSLSRSLASTGAAPGIMVDGDTSLGGENNNITTGIWAAGAITAGGNITIRHANANSVNFPGIDYIRYASIADETLSGSQSFSSFSSASPTVIYVNGNVTIEAGQYTGLTTVVATGTITIYGLLEPSGLGDFLALVTDKQITVSSGLLATHMIMYCHNSSTPGTIEFQESGTCGNVGSVCADSFVCSSNDALCTMNRNSAFTKTTAARMKLPGTF